MDEQMNELSELPLLAQLGIFKKMVTKHYPMEFQQCRFGFFESQQSDAGEQNTFENALEPCKRENITQCKLLQKTRGEKFLACFYVLK